MFWEEESEVLCFLSVIKLTRPHKSQKSGPFGELSQTEAVYVCLVSQYGEANDGPGILLSSPIPSLSESNTFQ